MKEGDVIKDDALVLVTLDQLMADYDGSLDSFMKGQPDIQNVLIHWAVSVDVKGQGQQEFQVGVAVCFTELLAEEAKDQLTQLAESDAGLVFAYIPAWQYGQKDFGIFIEQTSFGEILTNSLIAEVIEKAGIEQTLDARCRLS
ncbi:putative isochorismatase family protein [SAR116 cluster alpha proteobacterium HIMB100]|nr:putative isochorismatase family protein [SAR116 cluster alpha proteobacterium HIMB100]